VRLTMPGSAISASRIWRASWISRGLFRLRVSALRSIWQGADAAHGGPQLSFFRAQALADRRPRGLTPKI